MIDHVLIATSNQGKYREMAEDLEEIGLETSSLDDHGISLERPEKGQTYHENARIKADEAHQKTGVPSLAEDSGIEVDALDGRPGIRSDRWAGDATPEEKNELLLQRLEETDSADRVARYVSDMVLVAEGEEILHTQGTCEGRIAGEPRGDGGFGYDPIFEVSIRDNRTFGELGQAVKESISHRARALNKLISYLQNALQNDQPEEGSDSTPPDAGD